MALLGARVTQHMKHDIAKGMAVWLAGLLVLRWGAGLAHYELATVLLHLQDRWLLLAVLAGAGLMLLPWGPASMGTSFSLSWRGALALAIGVVALCWAGHYAVLVGYDLSRDEQMAVFDARIYATGRWAMPLPVAWRVDADVLNTLFMLPVVRPVAWVSGYLPGNALLRAGLGLIADPALCGPLLSGAAVLAVWSVARQLWPDSKEAPALAVLLLVTSGQMLFTGMTAYAMPAHLACNLLWLWLFLADKRKTDIAAVIVGCIATGLHQPIFHPLFVAPWLLLLLAQRRWGRLGLFAGTYLVIALFWLVWPQFVTLPQIMGPGSLRQPGADFASRLIETLRDNHHNLPIMAANLLRFCTWQSVAMVPLLGIGLWLAARHWRTQPQMAALAAGFVAPPLLMLLILPYQGHGEGYRYLHPVLGNGVLLAVYGWREWSLPSWRAPMRRALIGSALLLIPLQGWLLHNLYQTFAAASARIDATPADYVMIGPDDAPLALDLVLNRPDLSNRPIRLSQNDIDDLDRLAAHICAAGRTIALPTDRSFAEIDRYFGTHSTAAGRRFADDHDEFEDAGCKVIELR